MATVLTNNVIESPVGERIEITTDDDWIELTGCTPKALRMWNLGAKRFILTDLFLNGEVIDRPTGRAAAILWDRMRNTFGDDAITTQPIGFSGLIKDPMNAPAFVAERNAKRTYSIKLIALPFTWYQRVLAMIDELPQPVVEEPTPEPQPDIPEPPPGDREAAELMESVILADHQTDAAFDAMIRDMSLDAPTEYPIEPPPLDISIASQVAMSLLTTVVEIISAGSGAAVDEKVRKLQGDLNDVMGKLSSRLEDNDRMRRQLRQAGDEIVALRHERDGLRSRLRATEANLTAALKGDAVQAINGEIQKRVDAIMRVAPKGKGDE